jgi:hypothetical protein
MVAGKITFYYKVESSGGNHSQGGVLLSRVKRREADVRPSGVEVAGVRAHGRTDHG